MKTHPVLVSAVLLALSGCANDLPPAHPSDLMEIGNKIIEHGCPTAASVVKKKVANRHEPNVTDTIKTISCDGLEMQIYIGIHTSNPKGLPMYLELRKPDSRLPRYMNIGEPVRRVVAALGNPSEQTDRTITYLLNESDDAVTFSTHESKITGIRWAWYID